MLSHLSRPHESIHFNNYLLRTHKQKNFKFIQLLRAERLRVLKETAAPTTPAHTSFTGLIYSSGLLSANSDCSLSLTLLIFKVIIPSNFMMAISYIICSYLYPSIKSHFKCQTSRIHNCPISSYLAPFDNTYLVLLTLNHSLTISPIFYPNINPLRAGDSVSFTTVFSVLAQPTTKTEQIH